MKRFLFTCFCLACISCHSYYDFFLHDLCTTMYFKEQLIFSHQMLFWTDHVTLNKTISFNVQSNVKTIFIFSHWFKIPSINENSIIFSFANWQNVVPDWSFLLLFTPETFTPILLVFYYFDIDFKKLFKIYPKKSIIF